MDNLLPITSATLDAGTGQIYHRLPLAGNEVIHFEVLIQSPCNAGCTISIQFFDDDHQLLKTCHHTIDAARVDKAEIYTLSPALTHCMVAGLEKAGGEPDAAIMVQTSLVRTDPPVSREPKINLDEWELPFWEGDTVHDESVLLYSEDDQAPTARLLYAPSRVLSVQSYSLQTSYAEADDYTIDGNTMTRTPDSRMPFKRKADFPDTPLHYYEMRDSHIAVTYTHNESWAGPAVSYKGDRMPHTMRKLSTRQPLNIVAYGDSITRGMNVSSYDQQPPYMPTWAALFADILRKKYGCPDIRLDNAGLPGATSEWGASEADFHVSPLHPDLVVIAFGMNDFWSVEGSRFQTNIETIISKVKAHHAQAEFMLVSPMMFDPAYANDGKAEVYRANMLSYRSALLALASTGIQVVDMTEISEYLHSRKKPKDFLPNPLHPNDYLARWYGLGLAYSLIDRSTGIHFLG